MKEGFSKKKKKKQQGLTFGIKATESGQVDMTP